MYQPHTEQEIQAAENARDKVAMYCKQEQTSRKSFGEVIGLFDKHGGTLGRFMSGAAGTRGKTYPAIISFFRTYNAKRMLKKALANH
jgi:hypothetical protein